MPQPRAGGPGLSPDDVVVRAPPVFWASSPADLPHRVTPVYVEIRNQSRRPIGVHFADLRLVADGVAYAALPPWAITGTVREPLLLGRPTLGGGMGGRPVTVVIPLPTDDMLELGLREGVVEPGGAIAGFVYFRILPRHVGQLALEADLIDAATGAALGRAVVRLRVVG